MQKENIYYSSVVSQHLHSQGTGNPRFTGSRFQKLSCQELLYVSYSKPELGNQVGTQLYIYTRWK